MKAEVLKRRIDEWLEILSDKTSRERVFKARLERCIDKMEVLKNNGIADIPEDMKSFVDAENKICRIENLDQRRKAIAALDEAVFTMTNILTIDRAIGMQ